MTYQPSTLNNAENVGPLDRVNRFLLGMTLITVAVLFTGIPEAAIAGLVAAGFYTGLTAFIGWDPLYALINAYRSQASVPATSSTMRAYRLQQAHTSQYRDEYRQAA